MLCFRFEGRTNKLYFNEDLATLKASKWIKENFSNRVNVRHLSQAFKPNQAGRNALDKNTLLAVGSKNTIMIILIHQAKADYMQILFK